MTDAPYLKEWENDVSLWHLSGSLLPFSSKAIADYINSIADIFTDKQYRFIIEEKAKAKPVGCIDIFDFDPINSRAGVGILIGNKKDRMMGAGDESLKLLINWAKEVLHLHQLYCNIIEDNKASIALFEKHNFQKIGTKKDWIKSASGFKDEWMYQLIIN